MGRYLLFGILGVETMVLPYFLPREVYGEVEFIKFTIFLTQFTLVGAGTGYVVSYLKKTESSDATTFFFTGAVLHSVLVGLILTLLVHWTIAITASVAIIAIVLESVLKVNERYLLAMSYKPLLSLGLIGLLPLVLLRETGINYYVFFSFLLSFCVYATIAFTRLKLGRSCLIGVRSFVSLSGAKKYMEYIKIGFIMNISTAMTFVFFYIDRATIRENHPELLPDYSLAFSVMQMTIVAITTFSYVNIVEFGKDLEISVLKKRVMNSLKICFLFYVGIGFCSILFSFVAELFYGYDNLFESTSLMVVLFGLASVFTSVNSAHLYLGSTNILALMIFGALLLSAGLNIVVAGSSIESYYLLLIKTYGVYLLFSVCSLSYVLVQLKMRKKSNIGD